MNNKKENIKKWITFIILTLGAGTIYKLCFLKDAFYVPMQEYLGLTHTQIGNALSISGTVTTLGFIAAVWLSDRISKRILLPVGLIGTGLLGLWLATFPGYNQILLIWALFALTNDMIFWPVLLKSIKSLGGKDGQGRIFGYFEASRGLVDTLVAFAALGIFAYFGSSEIGFRNSILFYSITVIVIGIAAFFVLEDDKNYSKNNKEEGKKAKVSPIVAFKTKEIWLAAFNTFFVYAIYCGITYFIPFLKDVYALPVALVGAYGIITQYGLKMVGGPIGGYLADKKFHSPTKYIRFGFLICIALLVIMVIAPHNSLNVYTGMAMTLIFGAVLFSMRAVFFAPMGEINISEDITGAAMSIGSFIGYAPGMFCYSLYGNILDKNPGLSGYRMIFIMMIGSAVLGFIVSTLLVNAIKKIK
ncbi:MFS transporter [[Clostridium] dakarense]|uniref:MFS transporter n=1 Tax=Faecalimicrobium dakarense TaxID=1301100 RepID=UPI0004B342BC|nr:MFS transporter [[Clostridium] dakarense]